MAIGLLPTYADIGSAAPVLLLALRLIQGFCVGGELPGAVTYVVETAPERASFACGVVFACVNMGVLLATLVNLGVRTFLPDAAWGWRLGFLLGGALGLIGYPLRRTLAETPAFVALRARVARLPLLEAIRAYPSQMLIGVATTAATAAFNSVLFVLLPGYLARTLHYPQPAVALAQTVGVVAYAAGLLGVAWLGDRVDRRRLLTLGAALLLGGCYPWFVAAAEQSVPLVALTALAGLAAAWCSGVFAVLLADLFPARVRYSGVALPYNISFTVFGGLFPLLATAAIAATGMPTAPALLLGACAAVTLVGSLFLRGRP
jgi:MFS family permease